jgi:hypothetical protein
MTSDALAANADGGHLTAATTVHWDAFLEKLSNFSSTFSLSDEQEEAYVRKVARLSENTSFEKRIRPIAERTRPGRSQGSLPLLVDLSRRENFEVKLVLFDREEHIPLHDHPQMTGVMHCVSGSVKVESFERIAAPLRRKEDCLLRRTSDLMMIKGSVSTLTANRSNIHRLRATSVSQIIDIFTPPYTSERSSQVRYYSLEDESSDFASILRAHITSILRAHIIR